MKLLIQGGRPLEGEVLVRGAKNSCFKLMIASLLGETPSVLSNVTKAGETKISFSIINQLGGEIKFIGEHSLRINPRGINKSVIPFGVGKESRASTLFVPPLLLRFGKAKVPWPGGDRIGNRPLDRHFKGMRVMGIKIKSDEKWLYFELENSRPRGCVYRFVKNTHTGTDTLLMLAAFAEGETVLENAAQEPEVDDLIEFLNKMGAKIKRVAPRKIVIKGVKKMRGSQHIVIPDRNEAVTFACAALGTRGAVSIFNIRPGDLTAFIDKVREAGGKVEIGVNEMKVSYTGNLKATKVETAPHPGFMTDWQSVWSALMTQARGKSVIIERVYPNRFQALEYLKKMGAKVRFFNPQVKNPEKYYEFNLDTDSPEFYHGAEIWGPSPLRGGTVDASDIRSGAALLLAALMSKEKTVITNAERICRGYENIDQRLIGLGGKILKVKA